MVEVFSFLQEGAIIKIMHAKRAKNRFILLWIVVIEQPCNPVIPTVAYERWRLCGRPKHSLLTVNVKNVGRYVV